MEEKYLKIERKEHIAPHPELTLNGLKMSESYRLFLEGDFQAVVELNPRGEGLLQLIRSDGALYAGPRHITKKDLEQGRVDAPCDCTKENHWVMPKYPKD